MLLTELFPGRKSLPGAVEASGVAADSRLVRGGEVFVAVKGAATDGHDFIAEAVGRGAVAVVAARKRGLPAGTPAVVVKDTRRELARLAKAFHPRQPGMVAAVTGTNGKTSTAEFLRQIWSRIGWPGASMGTLGIIGPVPGDLAVPGLTTPDAVSLHRVLHRLADAGIDHLAIETSSHGLDQGRVEQIEVSVAGFTNLSHEHLDYHPDMEAYFTAKAGLFTRNLREGGGAVVNIDTPWGERLADMAAGRPVHVLTVGGGEAADLRVTRVEPFEGGLAAGISHAGRDYTLPLALTGAFQAYNAVLAAGMAHASGVAMEHALMSLPYLRPAPGRMQTIHGHPGGALVVVDYAHSPDALASALSNLRPQTRGRLGVVFGCGGDRDRAKRPEMGRIAAKLADFAIITDDNPRSEDPAEIRREIHGACPEAAEQGDRRQAIAEGVSALGDGDILLIAGKGHEVSQTIGSETLPFSDEATVRGVLAALGGAPAAGTGGRA